MLSLRIAVRFLKKSPAQTTLIIMGIAVGIAVQIFIGSLVASLQTYLIDQTLGSAPHLTLTASDDTKPVVLTDMLRKKIASNNNIVTVLPQHNVTALVSGPAGDTALNIKSGSPQILDSVYNIAPKITRGVYILNKGEIIVGKGFAEKYAPVPGLSVTLLLAGKTPIPMRISGIVDFGNKQLNENLAFTNETFGQAASGHKTNEYSSIILQLNDVFASSDDARELQGISNAITVTDWQIEQKDLLSGLSAQSSSTYMIQFFIILAVALGIASTLSISAIQKTRQIGILKALGLTNGRSGAVFLVQGAILGAAGSLGGLLLGLGLIGLFKLLSGSNPSLFPITPQAGYIFFSILIGITISMISAIIPSRRTAKLDPIEVIQSGG